MSIKATIKEQRGAAAGYCANAPVQEPENVTQSAPYQSEPQPSTATKSTALSNESVGQGEAARSDQSPPGQEQVSAAQSSVPGVVPASSGDLTRVEIEDWRTCLTCTYTKLEAIQVATMAVRFIEECDA